MPIIKSGVGIDFAKWKIYQAFANSDGNLLERLLQNPVAMQIFIIEYVNNSPIINSLANSQTAMNAIANSQTAMNAIINSQTAMNAIANSQTAMNAIANSQTAMDAIINSQTAMNAIINSQTAMNAIANSQTAMNAIANSQTAMNAIANSQTAMNAIANSQTAMNAIANSQTAMNAIINSQTAMNAIYSSSYRDVFINSTALTMISNTSPEGVVSASSVYNATYDAYRAMDKNTNTYWFAGGSCPQWIAYQFNSPVFIHTVKIVGYGSSGAKNNPNNVTIQYSDNGSTWVNVMTYNNEITNSEVSLIIPFKAGYYKYWRLYVNSIVNTSSYPAIRELNFIGFAQPS